MKKIKYSALAVVGLLTINSCKKDVDFAARSISAGSANFNNYIAVGNSLTQGHQDFGVHNENGQLENSFPAILSRQMALTTPSLDFVQPIPAGNGSGAMALMVDVDGELTPVNLGEEGSLPEDASWANWAPTGVQYNNMGISGITLNEAVEGSADGLIESRVKWAINSNNPYGRFLDWGTFWSPISYLEHIQASNATFFTCWLGNNDVLGWALAGGDETEFDANLWGIPIPFIDPIEITPLTDRTVFREKYDMVLDAFQAQGAKGVCATIPNVSTIPNLNTLDAERVGFDIWITASDGTVRIATERDLIPLTSIGALREDTGRTMNNPLLMDQVLDEDEVNIVSLHTILLNNEIKESAKNHNFPVCDMYTKLQELESGMTVDGINLTAVFVEGGAFSLDGVHPNERGYAMIANEFIEVINGAYGASIPKVDIGKYKGIYFPN